MAHILERSAVMITQWQGIGDGVPNLFVYAEPWFPWGDRLRNTQEVMMLVKVNARLTGQDAAISLEGLTAELFDKDPLTAALLAKGRVSAQGTAEFVFDLNKANDLDSLGETCPDLFVTVRDTNEKLLFRSGVIWNVPFLDTDPVTGTSRTTVNLDFQRE